MRKKTVTILLVAVIGFSLCVGLTSVSAETGNPIAQILQTLLGIQPKITNIENTVNEIKEKSIIIHEEITLEETGEPSSVYIQVLPQIEGTTYRGHATIYILSPVNYTVLVAQFVPDLGLYLGGDPRDRNPPETLNNYLIDADFACMYISIIVDRGPGFSNPHSYSVWINGVIQYTIATNATNIP